MDIFPTMLTAAGGDMGSFEVDGIDLMPFLRDGQALPDREIYWEMGQQTAVRRGPWKLVLNGQLVEGAPPEDDVHLSNLSEDMGERVNLKDRQPELTASLRATAEQWRAGIEARWAQEFSAERQGLVTHQEPKS
jgi:arylsulfatase A-like enzyme